MDTKAKIRALLPAQEAELFDDIVTGRVLGASRHVLMIGNMMKAIACMKLADTEKISRCIEIGRYFKETRGKSSYAIVSSLNLMMAGFAGWDGSSNAAELIKCSVDSFHSYSEDNVAKIIQYGINLVKEMDTIMVFDYSSTVERFVVAAGHPMVVYVVESRAIDGGRPFVKSFVEAGHTVRFIADAAILTVLRQVDAVFIGAETYYPDGTTFNTVGSDILAELCTLYRIPYYVLTPLIKIDMRAAEGIFKETIAADLSNRLADGWDEELRARVDFYSIELVGVKPRHITALVTEEGIIPPTSIFSIAQAFNDKTNKEKLQP